MTSHASLAAQKKTRTKAISKVSRQVSLGFSACRINAILHHPE
ncbi:hypothetical protein [Rubritalea tangerina]